MRKCAVRVAYACSKIGFFDKAKECLMVVELGFPDDKKNHPEYAVFLRKKTEIDLDSFEIKWPSNEEGVEKIKLTTQSDLLRAEEIMKTSLGCENQQYALIKKEQARLNIIMGNYQIAYNQICDALKIIRKACYRKQGIGHYLTADFLLIRSDAEGKLRLNDPQKESLKKAEDIYRNVFGNNHPMVALTLQKLYIWYQDRGNRKEAQRYLEGSKEICQILEKDLQEQLDRSTCDFLVKYKLEKHPILKRQQQITKKITSTLGAWQK